MLPENKNLSLQNLELETILARVSEHTLSSPGKETILKQLFISDETGLSPLLCQVTEMRDLILFDDPFPLHTFSDIQPSLKKAALQGTFLQPGEIQAIKEVLIILRQVKDYFESRPDKYCLLQKISKKLKPLPHMEKEINRVIDSSGEVKDAASDMLKKLRRDIHRKTFSVRKRLDVILRTMISKGYAQEDVLVLREGRLAVPMKETSRGQLKGLVLDQSASGATVFIEPIEILEINNEIRQLENQEKKEIERILVALTDRIRECLPDIDKNFKTAVELDVLSAKGRFSIQLKANQAQINTKGILNLKNARHPLLVLRESSEEVIPLTLHMNESVKTLVVTGPNAGGKTVALKTVGLLSLMHQHGLHIPADEGSALPLFTQIFADIGDQQSIEQDLSTFSSHIKNLTLILAASDHRSLVLLDEIGSATDPSEGAALAEAILGSLNQKECLTVATTHMGALKVFAHEHDGMENGSMVFDQKTLRPSYRFQMGIPGSSYAFEIAERLGIPERVIQKARELVGEERGTVDRLILHLEEQIQRTQKLLNKAEIKDSKLSGLQKLYNDKMMRIKVLETETKQKALSDAEKVLQEANTTIERVVREIREKDADTLSIQQAKKEVQKIKDKIRIQKQVKKKEKDHTLEKGDWVIWENHPGNGQIVSDPDRTGRVQVQWDNMKLRVPLHALDPGKEPAKKALSPGLVKHVTATNVSSEIDLRGMTAVEAVEAVEKYLSDVALSGLNQVCIIHGKGSGILRREINRFLKDHPMVKQKRPGQWNEGDTGVTILELK